MKHYGKGSVVNEFSTKQKKEFEDNYPAFARELKTLIRIHKIKASREFIDVAAHNLACLAVWDASAKKK